MSTLKVCPNCKRAASGGFFWVYLCNGCRNYYCYQCSGSNQAKRCPSCYDTSAKKYQKVHPQRT